jgi:hypothetical protein
LVSFLISKSDSTSALIEWLAVRHDLLASIHYLRSPAIPTRFLEYCEQQQPIKPAPLSC